MTYKLEGKVELPPVVDVAAVLPEPPPIDATDEEIAHGKFMKHKYSGVCHGPGVRPGGVLPDLRYMASGKHIVFEHIVLSGILQDRGMVNFTSSLTKEGSRAVHQYLISEAHRLKSRSGN